MKSALIGLVLLGLIVFLGARRAETPAPNLPTEKVVGHHEEKVTQKPIAPIAETTIPPQAVPISEDLNYATEFLISFDAARRSYYTQNLKHSMSIKPSGPSFPGQPQRQPDSKPIEYTKVAPDSLTNKIYIQLLADNAIEWAKQHEPIDITVPPTELLIDLRRQAVETSIPGGKWERFQGRTPNEFTDIYTFDEIRSDGVHVTSHIQIRVFPFTKHFLMIGDPSDCSHQLYTQIARTSLQTSAK